jgi:PAS domain S-box-containing protein
MGMFRSPERDRQVDFSLPHTVVSHCLFVRSGSGVRGLGDLRGRKVLIQAGDIMDDYANRLFPAEAIVRLDSPVDMLHALADGRGDAALLPRFQGLHLCRVNRLRDLRAVGGGLEPLEYCFAVQEGNTRLLALLNEGLRVVRENGEYGRLRKKWFGLGSVSFWERSEIRYIVYILLLLVALLAFAAIRGYRTERELQRKQKDLAEAESRWHAALDSSELGVFDWDLRTNNIAYSDYYWQLLGRSREPPGGTIEQWESRVHPDDLPATRANLDRHLRGDNPSYASEYRMRCADGSYRWFLARGKTLVRDAQGNPIRHLGTIADITERKEIELELADAKDLLEQRVRERTTELRKRVDEGEQVNRAMMNVLQDLQATNQKLERVSTALESTNRELDAFAYSISHDLRAPLRAIDGFARILQEDYASALDQEGQRLLDVIHDNAERMAQLINDLLAFSRLGRRPLDPTLVPMGEVVDEIIDELQRGNDSRTVFDRQALPTVPGDRAMLRQAFANLLENAMKYSAPKAEPRVVIKGTVEDGHVHYCVADTGIGFAKKHAARIFGVFERLHGNDQFAGTGVGLSLVQRIVVRHGGTVWAESEPGQGAEFHVRLPVTPFADRGPVSRADGPAR